MSRCLRLHIVASATALVVGMIAQGQELTSADSLVLTLSEHVPGKLTGLRDVRTIPYIAIETSRIYPCLLPLALRTRASADSAEVIVDGIAPVSVCPSAMGPASGVIGVPLSDGYHALAITTGERVDRYSVFVSDSILAVTPQRVRYTRFTATVYRRAPVNSFAFYCELPWTRAGPDAAQKHVCTAFVKLLRDSLAVEEFTFPPGGDLPYPVRGELKREDVRYFRYWQPEDFPRAYDLLQRFSRTVMVREAPRAAISLTNWRGRRITSYRCAYWQGCESIPSRPSW